MKTINKANGFERLSVEEMSEINGGIDEFLYDVLYYVSKGTRNLVDWLNSLDYTPKGPIRGGYGIHPYY